MSAGYDTHRERLPGSDPVRARDRSLPRCCAGWIAEQAHRRAGTQRRPAAPPSPPPQAPAPRPLTAHAREIEATLRGGDA